MDITISRIPGLNQSPILALPEQAKKIDNEFVFLVRGNVPENSDILVDIRVSKADAVEMYKRFEKDQKTKPCPACGKDLHLPNEYLDAVKAMREELKKFRYAIILDHGLNGCNHDFDCWEDSGGQHLVCKKCGEMKNYI